MSIHRHGINDPMTSLAYDDQIRKWARDLEDAEASRLGMPLSEARPIIASKFGIPAGTLENMRRNRIKGLRGWIRDRVQALVIREIEAEIQRLTHELEVALRCSAKPGDDEVIAARTALAQARQLIGEVVR